MLSASEAVTLGGGHGGALVAGTSLHVLVCYLGRVGGDVAFVGSLWLGVDIKTTLFLDLGFVFISKGMYH